MRYLIDTNIFVYLSTDMEYISRNVAALMQEPEAVLYMSAESVRELIVGYRNKGLCSKRWKSVEAMVAAIENEYYIKILPLKKEHMITYAKMEINEAQGHKDPSDHVIIAHAITEHLPLISSDTRFEFYRTQGLDLIFNQK
ncbi:PIN domain-containing protein [Bacteroides sp. GD17]|jgi:PIN domain nuclease of toxin-antitoxin system|uniref:type II toxin-antitoxin system VapC family toxin n=1 Tax=Bacteroides sp. GD17 TaxID=3139826 RepID=UPI0025E11569|nr:PIN domain-containing protein [uncultured Bacteroides sp.]